MYCRFKYFKGIWNMYVEKTFHISLFLKGIDWDCLMNEWHLPNSTVPWFVSLFGENKILCFLPNEKMYVYSHIGDSDIHLWKQICNSIWSNSNPKCSRYRVHQIRRGEILVLIFMPTLRIKVILGDRKS